MDYKGHLCGVDDAVKNCPYVAWIDVDGVANTLDGTNNDICVPACAGDNDTIPFDFSCYPDEGFSSRYMPADRELAHRCIPLELTAEAKDHLALLSNQKLFGDLQNSIGVIFICVLISIVLSFIWLELIKRWASEMIWASVFALLGIGVAFMVYLYRESQKEGAEVSEDSSNAFLNAAIIFTIVFVLIICVLIYLRKRISLTGELMEEAAAAVEAMPLLVVFPILPLFAMLSYFVLWFYSAMFIISSSDTAPTGDERFVMDARASRMFGFHVFALIWNLLFIVAVQDTTVAGSVATWYYTRDKANLQSPISRSLFQTLRYNLGSVAFGSLIVAIVKILTILFEAAKKSSEKAGESSQFAKFVSSCTSCLVKCFERFVVFITRNALIHVAIYNTSFCEGAHASFKVLSANMDKVFAVNSVGDFFLFICKISVSSLSALLCVVILQNHFTEVENRAAPAMIVFLLSYLIGCNFFGTIELSIDTILICFCHEEEQVQANPNYKPYMSDDLKQFIESSQKLSAKVGDEAVKQ
eukprot:c8748_g1_i1.p1 GENE.c8748_g1_i1~~c8748_g1_i1.p1  ORF type:complete len:581 (-),score=121.13 c8748_g1_i1:23-1606(-)